MYAETRRNAELEGISEIRTLKHLFVMNNLTGRFVRVPYEWGSFDIQQWHFFDDEKFISWEIKDNKIYVTTERGVVSGEL